jgi:hypothetical protein
MLHTLVALIASMLHFPFMFTVHKFVGSAASLFSRQVRQKAPRPQKQALALLLGAIAGGKRHYVGFEFL